MLYLQQTIFRLSKQLVEKEEPEYVLRWGEYCTVLYCTELYCTVLYCTVLYCTVMYCTVLYCTAFLHLARMQTSPALAHYLHPGTMDQLCAKFQFQEWLAEQVYRWIHFFVTNQEYIIVFE